jgi:hypothetical protein
MEMSPVFSMRSPDPTGNTSCNTKSFIELEGYDCDDRVAWRIASGFRRC